MPNIKLPISVEYPVTSSDSASATSNGVLATSNMKVKLIIPHIPENKKINQNTSWKLTKTVKQKDSDMSTKERSINPRKSSKFNIAIAARIAASLEYLLPLK